MKKYFIFFLVLAAAFFMTGCQKNVDDVPSADETPVQDTQSSQQQEETDDEGEVTDTSDEVSDEASDEKEETASDDKTDDEAEIDENDKAHNEQDKEQADASYTIKIERPDQTILDGPGYDYSFVGVVEEAGVYTIVEEVTDEEGNLWGRLKSGIGWVDLTEIRSYDWPISANFASDKLLESGEYHHWAKENQDYTIPVVFYAYEKLSYVTVYPMELVEDGFVAVDPIIYLDEFTPDKPLVAELTFPGDMTMYTIEFTDSQGAETFFRVYISGRNGLLILDDGTY